MSYGEWYITNGYDHGFDNGDTPVLAWNSSDDWEDCTICSICPNQEGERDLGYWIVNINTYFDDHEDYEVANFRRFPSARVIMRDPDLGDYLEKYGVSLSEIPTDIKERYLTTVEEWEASKVPGVWEPGLAIRLDAIPEEIDEDTYFLFYKQQDSPSEVTLQVKAEEIDDEGNIKWALYFVDDESSDITDEVMGKLGLESIRTFADDEKDFLETLKLVLPADEAKKAIRNLLVALR